MSNFSQTHIFTKWSAIALVLRLGARDAEEGHSVGNVVPALLTALLLEALVDFLLDFVDTIRTVQILSKL